MKFSPIVAALGAAASIVGVAVGPDEARSEDQFTVGVSVWDVSTTPFAVPLVKGMRDAAEAANVNLIVSDMSVLRCAFDDEHERIYTFKMEGDRVNFLHWRVNAAVGSSMPMPRRSASASEDPSAALTGHRTAYFGGKDGATEVPVYDGMQLEPGHVVRGAAVIEDAARRHAGSFRHVALRSVDRDLRQYRRGGDHRCRLQGIRNGRPPARDRRRCAGRIDL